MEDSAPELVQVVLVTKVHYVGVSSCFSDFDIQFTTYCTVIEKSAEQQWLLLSDFAQQEQNTDRTNLHKEMRQYSEVPTLTA